MFHSIIFLTLFLNKIKDSQTMKIQINILLSDSVVLDRIKRLVENNRETLGKDYFRAVELMKSISNEADFIKKNQYQQKVDQNTLISETK